MNDERPLVAWDVDDVLNCLTRSWFEHNRGKFPGIDYEMLRENPPDRLLGISRREYLESLDRFRAEKYAELEPAPEVLAFLRRYGERFRHAAVTATPRKFASVSAAWVMKHFGEWIRSFHFVPSARPECVLPAYAQTKGEVLAGFRGKVILIDDTQKNLESARAAGAEAIAFPAPWNAARNRKAEEVWEELLNGESLQ